MQLLEAKQIEKENGARLLFAIDHLEIAMGDRIGLVGANGVGKSTLLRILAGEEDPDSGTVIRRTEIAHVRQSGICTVEPDAYWAARLGVRSGAYHSGGERMRRAIAAAFSKDAPLLLADEPTTNLDLPGIELVQRLLQEMTCAFVLVSHDRALLDAVCTRIWELEDGIIRIFPGKYTDWLSQKARERSYAQEQYDAYRAERSRLTAALYHTREQARGMTKPPKRMGNSEARLHKKMGVVAKQKKVQKQAHQITARLEQLAPPERPQNLPAIAMPLDAPERIRAKYAIHIEHLTVRYGDRLVLDDVSFSVPTGSRTVVLGENGAGKSTLIRALAERGTTAQGVRIGYFSQEQDTLRNDLTVLENARLASQLPESVVRTILANLYLRAQDMDKPAGILSGGERAKLQLARLLAARPEVLLLDEPTNHIDLYTLEALETLLAQRQGTLVLVTHDRRLAQRLATNTVRIEGGKVHAVRREVL